MPSRLWCVVIVVCSIGCGPDVVSTGAGSDAAEPNCLKPLQRIAGETTVNRSPFGLHAVQGDFSAAAELGATSTRLMVRWEEAEPSPGRYAVERMDKIVAASQQHNLHLVPSLVAASSWATRPANGSVGRGNEKRHVSAPPRDMRQWLRFVTAFVERYDNDGERDMPGLRFGITHWQAGNEWMWQWQGTAEEYLEFLNRTAEVIKRVSPEAKVIAGGLTSVSAFAAADGICGQFHFELGTTDDKRRTVSRARMLKSDQYRTARRKAETLLSGAGKNVDIIDVHCYSRSPQELAANVLWIRRQMERLGATRPIWALETAGPFFDFTPQRLASDIVERHVLGLAAGLDRIFWSSLHPTLNWSDNYIRLALIDNNRRRTAAFDTYRLMTAKLADATAIEALDTAPGWALFRITRQTAGDLYVAWSLGGQQSVRLPVSTKQVEVTHLITKPGARQVQQERLTAVNGTVALQLSTPIFLKPIAKH